jgi:hypothetical protein
VHMLRGVVRGGLIACAREIPTSGRGEVRASGAFDSGDRRNQAGCLVTFKTLSGGCFQSC